MAMKRDHQSSSQLSMYLLPVTIPPDTQVALCPTTMFQASILSVLEATEYPFPTEKEFFTASDPVGIESKIERGTMDITLNVSGITNKGTKRNDVVVQERKFGIWEFWERYAITERVDSNRVE